MSKRAGIRRMCFVAGCVLIAASLLLLIGWQCATAEAAKKADVYVETLRELMVEAEPAVLVEKSNNEMPVLAVDGRDFVGLVELPENDAVLPVCADWDGKLWYPCRYAGSVYDRSMKIGATSWRGQFDFYREICVGDVICFTDMTGNRYAYEVADIVYRKHADNGTLADGEADLTLFIKNMYAFEYVIVYCEALA